MVSPIEGIDLFSISWFGTLGESMKLTTKGIVMDINIFGYSGGVLEIKQPTRERTMAHSIMCAFDAMAEAMESQRREEEKEKQTTEVFSMHEKGKLVPGGIVEIIAVCDNSLKGGS